MSAHGQKDSCMDLQKAGAALLLGSAGFRDVTERAETPAGRCSHAVVHPSSADTPEMQIPASHLLLTESGMQRMGPISWL